MAYELYLKTKTVSKKALAVLVAGVLLALPLQTILLRAVSAAETGTWIDGNLPQLQVGGIAGSAPPACVSTKIEVPIYVVNVRTTKTIDACQTMTRGGTFSNSGNVPNPFAYDYVGIADNYRIVNNAGQGVGVIPLAHQKGGFIFSMTDGNLNGGRSLRFGSMASGLVERMGNEDVLKINILPQPLKDNAGNIIHMMDAYAFSPDGEWMVIEAAFLGIVRIRLSDKSMQLVSTEYYQYGLGFRPTMTLAISNDGKTVLRSGVDLNNTTAFDLSGCQPTPFVVGSSANTTPGCRSRNLQQSLSSQMSGFRFLSRMRFNIDDKSVSGIIGRFNSSGVNESFNMTYSIAGYEKPQTDYMALGDSFSSGEGARNYELGTDSSNPHNKCHLSKDSYPYVVSRTLNISDFKSAACSGAISRDYYEPQDGAELVDAPLGRWLPGYRGQWYALAESGKTSVVTMSMIGNDVGFSNKIIRCVMVADPCFHFREDRESIAAEIYGKFDTLVSLYEDIQKTSENARVYVMGYPNIVGTGTSCGLNFSLDPEERELARGLATYLNAVVKAATEKAGVQYIDVQNAFAGHAHCDAGVKAVNGVTAGGDIPLDVGPLGSESFHPNAYGQSLMAQALLAQSQDLTKPMPVIPGGKDIDATKVPPYIGSSAYQALIGNAPGGGIYKRAAYTTFKNLNFVVKGVTFLPQASTQLLRPNSPYSVWLHSDPVQIGTISTDTQGQLTGQVAVPSSVPAGYHTIHILGQNAIGEPIDLYKTIYVAESEDDFDGDGVANDDDPCQVVEPSDVDEDRDGIDDACDGEITEPPADTTAPTVTGTPDRQPDAGEWYNHDVTINWTATDPEPSSGTPTQPDPTIASQEGMHTYTSTESCDPLDNCATSSLDIKLDKTAPLIDFSLSSVPSVDGWNKGDVTVTFTCSDATSGVAECSEPVTVHDQGGRIVTGIVKDNAGNTAEVNAVVMVDRTAPTITAAVSPAANADGWHNGNVTITPACNDDLSGVLSCSEATIVSSEGADQQLVSSVMDKAGNTLSTTTVVNIDKTLPTLGVPAWTGNPKALAGSATLTIPVSDNLSGVTEAEYFLGDTDPGQGNGATMTLTGGNLTTTFGTDFPTGVYKVSVRAKDKAGNWSAVVSDYLVVYNSDGVRMTGKRTIVPSLAGGDVLPGLITTTQTDVAKFGFNVRYDRDDVIHQHSDFQFEYKTGSRCNIPSQAQNCHTFELNATSIAWLTTQDTNNSKGIFQGAATLKVDGITSQVAFRLTGVDGERLDTTSPDYATLHVYAYGDDPHTATPMYRVSGEVARGNIRIRTQ